MTHPSQLIPSARQHRLGELSQEPELINDDPAHEAWRWSADEDDAPPGDDRGPASHVCGAAESETMTEARTLAPSPAREPTGHPATRPRRPEHDRERHCDADFGRLRDEALRQCDADYAAWRRESFAATFDAWRRSRRRP